MEHALFAYGSLMYPEIIEIVLGRSIADLEICEAVLKGYRRVALDSVPYPSTIRDENAKIDGVLIRGLGLHDISRLDMYEDKHYARISTSVETSDGIQNADAYIDCRYPRTVREWDRKEWEQEYLSLFTKQLRRHYASRPRGPQRD